MTRNRLVASVALALLAYFGCFVVAFAQRPTMDVRLSWTAPTQNTDGTPLTDLAGYKVYWGARGGPYPNSVTITGTATTYVVEGQVLAQNTEYCFVVTAFNSAQRESAMSNEACKTTPDIPDVPEPPTGVTVEITLNFGV